MRRSALSIPGPFAPLHVVAGWVLLSGFTLGSGCTQNFDQFDPVGSGGVTGASGGTGGGLAGGQGGVGGPGGCSKETDCQDDNPCTFDFCIEASCEFTDVPDGPSPEGQDLPSDCVQDQCEGGELVPNAPDDTETPDDQQECTTDVCSGGSPVFTPVADGTDCGAAGSGLECDRGECKGCTDPEQCPDPVVPACAAATCENETCGFSFQPSGTTAGPQPVGDCKTSVCDGAGMLTTQANPADPPVDGNPCTSDICTGQTPSNPPTGSGSPCPTGVCNGASSCVECTMSTHCTPPATCVSNACTCSDPTACAGKCGTLVDACGASQSCGACAGMGVCGPITPNVCCTPDPNFCVGRCNTLQNNCLQSVNCGPCGGGDTCVANVCVPSGGGGAGGAGGVGGGAGSGG
jgi:hypothetical protein